MNSRSSPCLRRALLPVATLLALLALPGVAIAQEADQAQPAEQSAEQSPEAAPAAEPDLELTVTPVVGDGPDDGDLVTDPETGLPTLSFSPTGPAEQTAAFDFTVTNTGEVALHDVAVSDARIGVVLDAASGTTLAPGEATTIRATTTFTYAEATSGTAGLVVTGAQATGSDDSGETVEATTESTIQVVAVLATPSVTVALEALVGTGDVVAGVGGMPTLSWSAEDAAAGDERTIHYRLTITNTGPVELVEVTAVVDVLGMQLVATDADTALAPGETTAVEVSHTITPDEMGGDPATGVEIRAVADVQATDDTGQTASATDEAVVLGVVVQPEALDQEVAEELPAAGPGDAGVLLAVVAACLSLGGALLLVSRPRTVAAARPRHRPATACRPRG